MEDEAGDAVAVLYDKTSGNTCRKGSLTIICRELFPHYSPLVPHDEFKA